MSEPKVIIQVRAPEQAIRTMALNRCAKVFTDDPCTEPCDRCWQEAERQIAEVNAALNRRTT
jgi:hypothetical protein